MVQKAVHCIQKPLQTEHVPGSAIEVAANVLASLETSITGTFVSILKDVTRLIGSQLPNNIQLEFVMFGYVLKYLSLERKHRDRHDQRIIEPSIETEWRP